MSGAREKALALLGSGSAKRDVMLLSLIRQISLTDGQKRLIEQMWQERQQHKEAEKMKSEKCKVQNVGAVLMALVLATAAGCTATYEKRFMDHDGNVVVIQETHATDWWNTLGTPDWMNVRHETITRDGKLVTERSCVHEPTHPERLDCLPAR